MLGKQRQRLPADYQIVKRRAEEERRAALETDRAKTEKWGNQARWETKTTDRIVKQQTALRAEELKANYLKSLNQRRQKLADLLEKERREYEEEFRNSFETPEQRRHKMIQRAKELKDAREKKRRELAEQCLKQRNRLAQDEMRLEQSRLRTQKVAKERLRQLSEREEQTELRKQEEEAFARQWEENRREKAIREEREKDEESRRNQQMKYTLDSQVTDKQKRLDLQQEELENERANMRRQWQREYDLEKEKAVAISEKQRLARKAIQEENLLRAQIQAVEAHNEKNLDKYLLEEQLRKDKEAEERQRAETMRMRREQKEFQQHLKEMSIKEQKDESLLERHRNEEQEKEWRKREAQWKKEDEQRQALWRDVDRTRQLQIKEKAERTLIEQEENRRWIESQKVHDTQLDAIEKEKVRSRYRQRINDQELLQLQIAEKQRQQDIQKQQEYLQEKRAARYHEQFEEEIKALRKEVQESDMLDNFPRKKMPWS